MTALRVFCISILSFRLQFFMASADLVRKVDNIASNLFARCGLKVPLAMFKADRKHGGPVSPMPDIRLYGAASIIRCCLPTAIKSWAELRSRLQPLDEQIPSLDELDLYGLHPRSPFAALRDARHAVGADAWAVACGDLLDVQRVRQRAIYNTAMKHR